MGGVRGTERQGRGHREGEEACWRSAARGSKGVGGGMNSSWLKPALPTPRRPLAHLPVHAQHDWRADLRQDQARERWANGAAARRAPCSLPLPCLPPPPGGPPPSPSAQPPTASPSACATRRQAPTPPLCPPRRAARAGSAPRSPSPSSRPTGPASEQQRFWPLRLPPLGGAAAASAGLRPCRTSCPRAGAPECWPVCRCKLV
jgi:hypothetical protein